MTTYTFRAIDVDSRISNGRMQARSETDLEKKLSLQGLTLIEAAQAGFFDFRKKRGPRFSQEELLDFSYVLYLIVSSGMPLLGGLIDLTKNRERKKIAGAAELLLGKVESGMALSDAMQEYPSLFPNYYVQMIRAGEASGSLEQMLSDVMGYIEWQINFRKLIRSSLAYPGMVMSVVALLVVLLFTFVFPRLVAILTGLRGELPLPTKVLIAVSGFVQAHYGLILPGLFAIVVALRIWLKTYRGRKTFDAFTLALPVIGDLARKSNLARYFRTLSTLNSAGLNIETTLTLASEVVHNTVLAEALADVIDFIMAGDNIAQAMEKTGAFPALVTDMIAIGEKTGNLDSAVSRVSAIFDKEVHETVKKVFIYVEPLTIVLLGALVLFVLLSIFLPLYRIAGSIRGR